MKKVKLIILLGLVIILSGCKANYSVNISSNGKVTEKLVITADTSSIEANDPKALIQETIKAYNDNNIYVDYNIKTNVSKNKTTIIATRKYSSMHDYINKSELLPSLFEKTSYTDEYGIYGMQTTGQFYYDAIYDLSIADDYLFDTIDIDVHSQFELLDNNAEKFDRANNTLHWNINDQKKVFSIDFKYNNSKKYDIIIKDYLKKNWLAIILLVGAVVSILVIIRFIKNQNKLNNKI